MIKELSKIANELDKRGLVKEADIVDALLKKAYSPSNALRDLKGGAGAVKEVLYDTPKRQWSKGVGQTLEVAGEEASEVASKAMQDAFSAIINNPDYAEWLSIGTKIAAAAAIIFPEPATSAGGVAAMKASGFLDVIAAIGYAKAGRNVEAFFSLVASIAVIPAGPLYRIFTVFKKLRFRGKKMPIDMKKIAPVAFGAGATLALDTLIGAAQEVTKQATSIVEKYNSSEEGTLYAGTTGTGASVNSPVGIVNVNDIANGIIAGAQEVQNELEGWKEIVA